MTKINSDFGLFFIEKIMISYVLGQTRMTASNISLEVASMQIGSYLVRWGVKYHNYVYQFLRKQDTLKS